MKKIFTTTLILSLTILLISSCKSEFEKIRVSGDFDLLYNKAFEYYEKEDWLKAQTLFELVINNLRGKTEAEKVYFYYANTHFFLQKYILASYYYKNFAGTFPNSEYREESDYMTAFSQYKLSPSFRLDQSNSVKAIEGLELFVNTYPQSERVIDANKLIDEMRAKLEVKAFNEAQLYFDLQQYQAAVHSFEGLLTEYPETERVQEVRFMIVKASFLLAEKSVYNKKQERFESTLNYANIFLKKYNSSIYNNEVEEIIKNSNKQLKALI